VAAVLIGAAVVAVAAIAAVLLSRRAGRRRDERRVGDLAGILAMDGRRFDAFVARLYRKDGWWAFEPHAADEREGVDIRLERDGETWLVRARNWRYRPANLADVREFYTLVADRGASGGFFVTTSRYSPEAQAFAKRVPRTRPLGLIDADELLTWARRGRVAARAAERAPSPPDTVLDSFRRLGPPEFEQQVVAAWIRQGYAVAGQAAGGVGGIIAVERDGERLFMQCVASSAGAPVPEGLGPLMDTVAREGKAGVLITAVDVPSDLRRRLRDQRVDVIEGPALARFLAAGQGNANYS
jgi:restriction endonuclease